MATDEQIAAILAKRRGISVSGRMTLAEAVAEDHDWALTLTAVDRLIAAVSSLSDADLEAARLLAGHLEEAITCVLIRRDTAKLVPLLTLPDLTGDLPMNVTYDVVSSAAQLIYDGIEQIAEPFADDEADHKGFDEEETKALHVLLGEITTGDLIVAVRAAAQRVNARPDDEESDEDADLDDEEAEV